MGDTWAASTPPPPPQLSEAAQPPEPGAKHRGPVFLDWGLLCSNSGIRCLAPILQAIRLLACPCPQVETLIVYVYK